MWTFRAMNTDVTVIGTTDARIAQIFADAEARFSRFRADSELSQLNAATGPMVVSQPMFDALLAARRYVELTDGIFDPAIGATLAALGYDRSFAPGALDRDAAATAPHARFLDVVLDAETREVTRPADLKIDLGGMMKGRTVDAAAACLPATGAIDAGGDAVMRGGDWPVEVEDPRDPTRTIATLTVRDGAVATSAPTRRHWKVGGETRHHIVNPATQRSASSDLLQATVVAPTAELADVCAKTIFILGAEAGLAFAHRMAVTAVVVTTDGEVLS